MGSILYQVQLREAGKWQVGTKDRWPKNLLIIK